MPSKGRSTVEIEKMKENAEKLMRINPAEKYKKVIHQLKKNDEVKESDGKMTFKKALETTIKNEKNSSDCIVN